MKIKNIKASYIIITLIIIILVFLTLFLILTFNEMSRKKEASAPVLSAIENCINVAGDALEEANPTESVMTTFNDYITNINEAKATLDKAYITKTMMSYVTNYIVTLDTAQRSAETPTIKLYTSSYEQIIGDLKDASVELRNAQENLQSIDSPKI